MQRMTMFFTVLVLLVSNALGQATADSLRRSSDTRTLSVFAGFGIMELAVVGVQYQVASNLAIGIKGDIIPSSAFPGFGTGGGLKISYFFTGTDIEAAQPAINLEISYLMPEKALRNTPRGTLIELTGSYESIEATELGLYGAVGFEFIALTDRRPHIFPYDPSIGKTAWEEALANHSAG